MLLGTKPPTSAMRLGAHGTATSRRCAVFVTWPAVCPTYFSGQVLESTRSPSDGGEEDADRAELEDKLRRSVDVGR